MMFMSIDLLLETILHFVKFAPVVSTSRVGRIQQLLPLYTRSMNDTILVWHTLLIFIKYYIIMFIDIDGPQFSNKTTCWILEQSFNRYMNAIVVAYSIIFGVIFHDLDSIFIYL